MIEEQFYLKISSNSIQQSQIIRITFKYGNIKIHLYRLMKVSLPDPINQTKPISDFSMEIQEIPLLDLQNPDFPSQIVHKFKSIGFVIIKNHGIPHQLIDQAFQSAKDVFQLPLQQKKVKQFNFQRNRGYTGSGEQVLDEGKKNDEKKQTLDLGRPQIPQELQYYPQNQSFIKYSQLFYNQLFQTNVRIMKAIEQGLHLQQGTITNKCCKHIDNQTIRYLYYPEVTLQQINSTGKIRCGAHSDYGTITLLFQKPGFGQNGLRALNPNKQWVKVIPPDYSMVVNLGDLFQHWTNDLLMSTIHRVEVDEEVIEKLQNKEINVAPERQSIVMFCDPDEGEVFECLKNVGQPKYPPFNGKQYVIGRVKKTYGQEQ